MKVKEIKKKYRFYKCPLCGEILRRDKKVKESYCSKYDRKVKLKKVSGYFIKNQLKNCHEDSRCECVFYNEEKDRCIFFDGNHRGDSND